MNRIINMTLLVLVIGLVSSCTKPRQEPLTEEQAVVVNDYHSRHFLLEPAELQARLEEGGNLLLIEVNKEDGYAKGHLPGAHRVWRPDYGNERDYAYDGMRADRQQMEALLSRLGASPETLIIIYDEKGEVDAARLWWLLRRYGHEKLALLNGGKTAWQAAGYALTPDVSPSNPTDYHFAQDGEWTNQSIDMAEVLKVLEDTGFVIIDTRSQEEYDGSMQKKGAAKAGRIPGSIHIDWAEAINYGTDFRFKTFEDLKALYGSKVPLNKKIITYCHTGVRSAHTTFVLTELLGYREVKNYDGSWTEWSHHDHLPFEK